MGDSGGDIVTVDGERGVAVDLERIRPLLSCTICGKWLNDAHTIMECLHSFCYACLRSEFGYEGASRGAKVRSNGS